MNEYEIHERVMKQVCKEISAIAEQIEKTGTMSDKDLERLDKLYHVKKDMLTANAMVEAEGYSGDMSGARGRSPMTGRYVSRESRLEDYNSGFAQGYSQAMAQRMMNSGNGTNASQANNNSGHYIPNYPYPERNW